MIQSLFMKVKRIREVRRKKLLRFLESDTPAWKDTDHPELARGAAAWVRALRQEGVELEMREPGLKGQIRKSSEEYRSGKKREAGAFLAELRRKPVRPKK